VLVVYESEGEATANGANGYANGNGAAHKPEPAATAVGDIKETLPGLNREGFAPSSSPGLGGPSARPSSGGGGSLQSYFNEKPLATPATRKLARDMDVDLRNV